jgi:hypothetical protein
LIKKGVSANFLKIIKNDIVGVIDRRNGRGTTVALKRAYL